MIRLAPGLRLNVSGSGLSLSAGPRGASMTFGGRGAYLNTGIPGTGLYARDRLSGGTASAASPRASSSNTVQMSTTISIEDDGTIVFKDKNGNLLDEYFVKQVKQQAKDAIQGLMQSACDEINGHIDALEQIHFATPDPDVRVTYAMRPYEELKPSAPIPRKHGVMGALFGSTRARIDKENTEDMANHKAALLIWTRHQREHDAREFAHKDLIENKVLTALPAMEIVLEKSLLDISWPRETELSTEVRDDGRLVMVDIDLPEIEELPRKTATMPARGYKLSIKELPVTRHQQLYMRHIHGIGFRVIGEIFSVLPKAEEVVLSAYTQRPDKATGEILDQYLYSVRVSRRDWGGINFANLDDVDASEALGGFDIRRDMTKTGVLKAIEPFGEPDTA
jgi:hypothetical protein